MSVLSRPLHRSRGGLTLVEVLAVVVILSLLAVTLVVGLGGKVGTAKHHIAQTQIVRLSEAVETYQTLQGQLPSRLEDLAKPNEAFSIEPALLKDPWGQDYHFLVPGPEGRAFEIKSLGSDGQTGGTGDKADLSSASLGTTAE